MLFFFADISLPMEEKTGSHLFFTLPIEKLAPLAIIKIPNGKLAEKYDELICTPEDVINIQELIQTLGTHGKIDLFLHHEKRLRTIEQKIRHVHPLKFLAVIFRDPVLKSHMKKVYGDFFIQKNFLDNLSTNLNNEIEKRKIYPFLTDFCKEISQKEMDIKPFVDRKDWKGLVNFLTYPPENS